MLPNFLPLRNRGGLSLQPAVTVSSQSLKPREDVLPTFTHCEVQKPMSHVWSFCYNDIPIQVPNSVLFYLLLYKKASRKLMASNSLFILLRIFWSRLSGWFVSNPFVALAEAFRARESTYKAASSATYLIVPWPFSPRAGSHPPAPLHVTWASTAWWPQGGQTSYVVGQGSHIECSKGLGRSCQASYLLVSEVPKKPICLGFPGGAVVESLPADAGDTGSSPGLGGSHMPRSN